MTKFKEYLIEKRYESWFELGKESAWLYKDRTGNSTVLRPKKELLKKVADELNVNIKDVIAGLSVYNSEDPRYEEKQIKRKLP